MQYKILTDERLSQYIKFPNLTKAEELKCIKNWIKEADESKYEKWVITLKDNNIPIGNISVNGIEKKHNYCNVGYVIIFDIGKEVVILNTDKPMWTEIVHDSNVTNRIKINLGEKYEKP